MGFERKGTETSFIIYVNMNRKLPSLSGERIIKVL